MSSLSCDSQGDESATAGSASELVVRDTDNDGVADATDNCPRIANPTQTNSNGVGPGDACELSLVLSSGLLNQYARFGSNKQLVITFIPFALPSQPDLLRLSASPALATPHYAVLTRRLGVRSLLEILSGMDRISGSEVLRIEVGRDSVLGGAKASKVWLRVDGTASVAVTFFDGSTNLGAQTISNQGTGLKEFAPSAGLPFTHIEVRASSGNFSLVGPSEGVMFALANASFPCLAGYRRVNNVCQDINECAGLDRMCDVLTSCTNTVGNFTCGPCPAGYTGTGETGCVDINECTRTPRPCSPLVACNNSAGSYTCGACPAGYRGDGRTCTDIDECAENTDGCDALALCTNTPGSYTCSGCPQGYTGSGSGGCVDINECQGSTRVCDPLVSCVNRPGSFECGACPAGYRGNGFSGCVDIDECAEQTAQCSPIVTCGNTPGSYQCAPCPMGYRGDGRTCTDVDECLEGSAQCSPVVPCVNTIGAYTCGPCPAGYTGDGRSCVDVNECQTQPCDPRTTCSNVPGTYQCGACPAGFTGDGHSGCLDIDECAGGTDDCSDLVTCANTAGGFQCGACPAGYQGDGRTCSDVDECALHFNACDALVTCTNTVGSYQCGACPPGYTGDGQACTDVNECAGSPCHALTSCTNLPGSFSCSSCPNGYTGDGRTGCVDIDECAVSNGGCPPTERCVNTAGSRTCEGCLPAQVGQVTTCGVGACAATGVTSCALGVLVDSCTPSQPGFGDATCDGRDDDCDGLMDEDYVGHSTSCGVGACASTGATACVGGVVQDSCRASAPAGADASCNGVDDDCNGVADEDYAPVATACGVGACAATGATSCQVGQVVNSCHAGAPAQGDATCNGVDDDCDGVADEEYAHTQTSCGVGVCVRSGSTSCVLGQVVNDCLPGEPALADDSCNGQDDDCDGQADEEYPAQSTHCGVGVCANSGQRWCEAGQVIDSCAPLSAAPDDTTCDGLDDDCNGEADEDYTPPGTSCGVGACGGSGLLVCVGGQRRDTCNPGVPSANDQSCNGIDDDCDGQVDEDFLAMATSCGVGACAAQGSTRCQAGHVTDSCLPEAPAANDASCDGRDDDCDGQVDEEFVAQATTCGIGACASGGATSCVSGGVQDSCQASQPALDDATCNGVDDDCNGQVDDGYQARTTQCGVGACATVGATSCVQGSIHDSCQPRQPATSDSSCDGVDDDCDGTADEGYAAQPTSCGVGACASTGATSCVAGVVRDSCQSGVPAAADAVCNGVDEDCSGQADEDYASIATACGAGACAATGATRCEGGQVQDSCRPAAPAPNDATCDGVDDDCDGERDEDYVVGATSCGVGACAASGVRSCSAGQVHDSCAPASAAASDANCDGVDDDCDGSSDEEFVTSCSGTRVLRCVDHLPASVECADGNVCNGAETCAQGACGAGAAPSLDDHNACTADSCDPATGVSHAPLAEGTPCGAGRVCSALAVCVDSETRIVRQPASVTVSYGAAFQLVIEVQGANLTYQWFRNGAAIDGANEATFSKASATAADHQAEFFCRVGGAGGVLESSAAIVTVVDDQAPQIVLAGGSQVSVLGTKHVLRGHASDVGLGVANVSAVSSRFGSMAFAGTLEADGSFALELPVEVGTNAIVVSARDRANNVATAGVTVTGELGDVPIIVVTAPQDGATVTSDLLRVTGHVRSRLPAEDIRLRLGTLVTFPTGTGGDYTFGFDVRLTAGDNTLRIQAETRGGSVTHELHVRLAGEQPTAARTPPVIELYDLRDPMYVSTAQLVLRGRVITQSCLQSLQVGSDSVAFSSTGAIAIFERAVPVASSPLTLRVRALDCQGVETSREIRVIADTQAPDVILDQLSEGMLHAVKENPYRVTGVVSDANLAGLAVEGRSVGLLPTGRPHEWSFAAEVGLARAIPQTVVVQAWDVAGNMTSREVRLLLDTDAALSFLSPSDGASILANSSAASVNVAVRLSNVLPSDMVSIQVDGAEAGSLLVTGSAATGTVTISADGASHTLSAELRSEQGTVLARDSVRVSATNPSNEPLALVRHTPASQATGVEPTDPIELYFNHQADPETLSVQVTQTFHGVAAQTDTIEVRDLLNMGDISYAQVELEGAAMTGRLTIFDDRMAAIFQASKKLLYGARVNVEVRQGDTLAGTFTYDVRPVPARVAGNVLDTWGNLLAGVEVEIPALGLSAQTDDRGAFSFGFGRPASEDLRPGSYLLHVNRALGTTGYGSSQRLIEVRPGAEALAGEIMVQVFASEEPFRRVASGDAQALLADGAVRLDLSQATLMFPDGQTRGDLHCDFVPAPSYGSALPNVPPGWGYAISPSGIAAEGVVGLSIALPRIKGSYDYVSHLSEYTLLLGLDAGSLSMVPRGVLRVDRTTHRLETVRPIALPRLDVFSLVYSPQSTQELLGRYVSGDLSIAQLTAELERSQLP